MFSLLGRSEKSACSFKTTSLFHTAKIRYIRLPRRASRVNQVTLVTINFTFALISYIIITIIITLLSLCYIIIIIDNYHWVLVSSDRFCIKKCDKCFYKPLQVLESCISNCEYLENSNS